MSDQQGNYYQWYPSENKQPSNGNNGLIISIWPGCFARSDISHSELEVHEFSGDKLGIIVSLKDPLDIYHHYHHDGHADF
jgi:hypothetical protein